MKTIIIPLALLALVKTAESQGGCDFCPTGVSQPAAEVPQSDGLNCTTLAALTATLSSDSQECANYVSMTYLCCPESAEEPPCDFCPSGLSVAGETIVDASDNTTCGDLFANSPLLESESPLCASVNMARSMCCPPTTPCTMCPSGITAPDGIIPGVGEKCSDVAAYALNFDESEDTCSDILNYRALCCPSDIVPVANPCNFCGSGVTDPQKEIPVFGIGEGFTCGILKEFSKTLDAEDDACYEQIFAGHSVCCPPTTPCTFCPNGYPKEGMIIPDTDGTICEQFGVWSGLFEEDSDECRENNKAALVCCPDDVKPHPTPCDVCPGGIKDKDTIIPLSDGTTCGLGVAYAKTVDKNDAECFQLMMAAPLCCLDPPVIDTGCPFCENTPIKDRDMKIPTRNITCGDLDDKKGNFLKTECVNTKAAESICCPEIKTPMPTAAPAPGPTASAPGFVSFVAFSMTSLVAMLIF